METKHFHLNLDCNRKSGNRRLKCNSHYDETDCWLRTHKSKWWIIIKLQMRYNVKPTIPIMRFVFKCLNKRINLQKRDDQLVWYSTSRHHNTSTSILVDLLTNEHQLNLFQNMLHCCTVVLFNFIYVFPLSSIMQNYRNSNASKVVNYL